jgi:hypothetical protein
MRMRSSRTRSSRSFVSLIVAVAVVVLCAGDARADAVLAARTGGKGLGMALEGETVTYLRGTKMRSDATIRGENLSTIIDLDQRTFISINHKKREAEIWDMASIASELGKITDSDIKVDLKPTGETREILDQRCDGYQVRVAVNFALGDADQRMTILMAGPVWVAKNSPAKADYAAFYTAAADRGLFFSDPRAAKAQPGQARGMTALYRRLADIGVIYASEIEIRFEGSGMLAAMMNKMGGSTMTTTVTKVAAEAVPDDMFIVPAGYKTKKSK